MTPHPPHDIFQRLTPEESHTLRSIIGRVETFERRQGQTVWGLVEEYKVPVNNVPTIALLNGEPILRKDWNHLIGPEEYVTFVAIPQGDFFKDIIRLIATLALAVIAPWAAGIIGGFFGITGGIGLSLIQAGIVIAGSFLINALLPPSVPERQETPTPSPTYSLQAQGNQARLYQPIPKQYGEHVMFCDFASQPYHEFDDNKQVLFQLFSRGLGRYVTTEVRVEDTKVWDSTNGYNEDFVGVEIEFVDPGEKVTLFDTEVVTSVEVSGIDMPHWYAVDSDKHFAQFTFNAATNKISTTVALTFQQAEEGQKLEVPAPSNNEGIYTIIEKDPDGKWVIVSGTIVNETWTGIIKLALESQWIGGYVANPPDTVTNKLQIDFFFPRGMYYVNDKGGISSQSVNVEVQAQIVDSAGQELSSWVTIGNHTFRLTTTTPQRVTQTYHVDDARYKVRVRRTTFEDKRPRWNSQVQWGALRAFLPNDNNYPDLSLMAVKMTATGQLSSLSSRRFNVIQKAILPVYKQTPVPGWYEESTRSIAWAAYDIATNADYGGGLPPDSIDLDQLIYLDGVWSSRGDYFDAIFDSQQDCWSALTACLRAGRTLPVLLGGTLTFRRRENAIIPKGIFTPNNIVRGSFETEHILITEDTPDDIIVEFLDRRTWKRNEVRCILPDSTSEKPERMQFFGVTERLQAWREGIFAAAFNSYNRVVAQLTTEYEGRLLLRSDIVYAAHDLYEWGQWGEVEYYVPADRIVVLDRDVELPAQAYMVLQKRNGKGWGPVKISPVFEETAQVVIDAADLALVEASQGPIEDVWALFDDQMRTRFILCEQTIDYKRFSVVSGAPSEESVDLVLLYDDPKVHTAELTITPPSEIYPFTPGSGTGGRPVVPSLTVTKTPGSPNGAPVLVWSWGGSTPASIRYELQISYDNFSWETIFEGNSTTHSEEVFPGMIYSRVRGETESANGPWKTHSASFGTATTTPLPPTNLVAEADVAAGTLLVQWSQGVRATSYNVEVWIETTIDSTVFNIKKLDVDETGLAKLFTSQEVKAVGGPWKNIEIRITSVNSAGSSSAATLQLLNIGITDVETVTLVDPYKGEEIQLQWTAVPEATSYEVTFHVAAVLKKTATVTTNNYILTEAALIAAGGPWRTVTAGVRPIANALRGNRTDLVVSDPAPAAITGLVIDQTDLTELSFSWNAVGDADFTTYELHMSTSDGFTPGPTTKIYEGTSPSHVQTAVTAGLKYVRVFAKDTYVGLDGYNQGSQAAKTVEAQMLTNGDMTGSLTGWSVGTNWAYGTNDAVHTAGAQGNLSQTLTLANGQNYRVRWDQTMTAGSMRARLAGGTPVEGADKSANGRQTQDLLGNATSNGFLFTALGTTAAGTVDNFVMYKIP